MSEDTETPRPIRDGRPNRLVDPVFFRVRFERAKLREIKGWCEDNLVSFSAFVRKAVEEMYKMVSKK